MSSPQSPTPLNTAFPSSSQPLPAPQSQANITTLPIELQTQIHRSLSKVDSFCLGLTHKNLYSIHFSIYGPTGLFEGSCLSRGGNVKWGIECHVRIQDWLFERGLRVGFVNSLPPHARSGEGRMRGLVSLEEWERNEQAYLTQIQQITNSNEMQYPDSEIHFLATYKERKKLIVVTPDINEKFTDAKRLRWVQGLGYLEHWDVKETSPGKRLELGTEEIVEIRRAEGRWGRWFMIDSLVVLVDVVRRKVSERAGSVRDLVFRHGR